MLCFLTPHFQTRCGLAVLLFLEPRETESPPSPKTAQGPCLPPEGPFWPVSTPGGGTTRLRPVRGWFGPHRAQFGRRKRKRPILPVGGRFGGVKKEQVKGPGSPTGVPCRVTSPGRAGRSGIFPRRQFPHFPGSVWRPWGHDRGQKHKISRRQAIFPGVAAGVNERMKKKWQKKT